MNRHEDIRLLIQAFTAPEKKQLLENCRTAFAKPLHLKLLCRQPDGSAAEMAKRLHLPAAQYKTSCEKTYNRLLEFIRQTKMNTGMAYQLQQLQAAVEAQIEKGLLGEAEKTVIKGIALAQRYELHAQEQALQYQYMNVLLHVQAQTGKEVPAACLHRIAELNQQQAQTNSLRFIHHQLLRLRYKYALCILPAEQEELARIEQKLNGVTLDKITGVTARIYFYQAQMLVCFMLGRTENILSYNEGLLQCWQQHSHLIAVQPELFIRSASGQAYTHFLSKDVSLVSLYLEQYRQLAACQLPNAFYQHWFAIIAFHTTLKVLHKTYQYQKLDTYFSEQWPSIYCVLHVLQPAEKIDILLSACITFFALQRWVAAEALILELKEANHYLRRSDTLYFSFIFHCLILYEQREWSRLHSLINCEYHFLYRKKSLRPFERDMLLFIKKLPLLTISANGTRSLKVFLQKLNGYKQHPVHRLHFAYFDFYSWLESKIEGISYMELVKRNALESQLKQAQAPEEMYV